MAPSMRRRAWGGHDDASGFAGSDQHDAVVFGGDLEGHVVETFDAGFVEDGTVHVGFAWCKCRRSNGLRYFG